MVATTHNSIRLHLLRAGLLAALALTALISLAGSASAQTIGCRGARVSIADSSHADTQRAVLCLVNHERRSFGLPRLVADSRLDRSAQDWTDDMVHHDDFSHGAAFMDRISAAGFHWSSVAENIATGYTTPSAVVDAWMASQGHCANILSPVYREVGTGVADSMIRGASNIDGTWTQDFGLIMGQHSESADYGPAEGCPYR